LLIIRFFLASYCPNAMLTDLELNGQAGRIKTICTVEGERKD
jgi:hypothetical protein